MAMQKRREDRRIQRTRQVLLRSFIEVVREKGFAATSIHDITEHANVNRGTFYHHFADKYMLMDTLIREDFQRLLANTLPPTSRWDRRTLYLLIKALLDHFEGKYRHQQHMPHIFASVQAVTPLIERAIREELTGLLVMWLKQGQGKETQWSVPVEAMARVVSWAISGPAIQWSQEETTISSEQMSNDILLVIMEGLARLVPDALPE